MKLSLMDELGDKLGDEQLGDELGSRLGDELGRELGDEIGDEQGDRSQKNRSRRESSMVKPTRLVFIQFLSFVITRARPLMSLGTNWRYTLLLCTREQDLIPVYSVSYEPIVLSSIYRAKIESVGVF